MNIPKAIEILTRYMKCDESDEPLEFDKAIKLGIEALKKLKECQAHNCTLSNIELPGETED